MSSRLEKVGAVAFAVLMVTSMVAGTAAVSAATVTTGDTESAPITAQFGGGAGTDGDPYVITNASELQEMNTDLDASYKLGNSIDASGTDFDPVGNASNGFNGSFDGMGYTISNLAIDAGTNAGLFGFTKEHTVVENVTIISVSVKGDGSNVGGLIGQSSSDVTNVSVTGSVSSTGDSVGGVIGFKDTGNISNSNSSVSVVTEGDNAGGIVGTNFDGAILNSWAAGSVEAKENVGGLVGINDVLASNKGIIKRSYATSAVTGQRNVGGVVGHNVGDIDDVYAAGPVSGEIYVGGLAGSGFLSGNLYFDSSTTTQPDGSGTFDNAGESLPTAELKGEDAKSNTEFDFTSNWRVVATDRKISYPYLRSNPQTPAPGLEIRIQNWTQLHEVRNAPGATYKLTADLNETTADYDTYANASANGGAGWEPIGNATSPFTGSFDGANYTISDLTVDRPTEDEIGLFGTVDSAGSVGNVVLDNLSVVGRSNVGGFVGNATGSAPIEHVHITGAVNATGDTKLTNNDIDLGGVVGTIQTTDIQHATTAVNVTANIGDDNQQHIGGLVGFADQSDIHNVSTSGAVTVNGSAEGKKTGGLVGYITDGNISDSDTEGSVTATIYVGGLAGQFTDDNANPDRYMITNSSATGEISALAQAGGLVGQADYLNINGSSASGHVTVSDADAGGLVGLASSADIVNSSSTGNVNATQNSGGLIGIAQSTVIVNSSADGDVTIDELSNSDVINAGGLVGQLLDTDIVDSSATGNLRGTKQIGGLVGLIQSGDIDNSTASGDVNGIESTGLSGKIESQSLGGLVGLIQGGNVTDSTANGDVAGAETAGGLVGKLNGPITITRSHASGDVTGNGEVTEDERGRLSGNSTFGGLIGSVESGTVVDSSATGSVAGRQNIGGLVGSNLAVESGTVVEVTGSYATGTVSGDNNVGGLVGVSNGNVSDSYATGAVSGNQFVGGALGLNIGKITHAYAAGAVTGTDSTGGLVGNASVSGQTGTTQSSYWDTRTTGQSTSAGNATGLTTLDLKGSDAEANTNLDFATTWSVLNNESHISYPYLQANTQEPAPGITTVSSGGNNGNGGNGDGSSGRSSGGSSSGGSGGNSGGADPQSVVSVSPVTDPDGDRSDGDSSTPASGDGDRPGAAAQAVSVRNVDPGERVAIVFESPDSEESTTDDETTIEGARPTEEPGAGAEPGEASRTSLRNVVPDGLDITFKRSGDYDLEVSSRDIDVFDRAMDDSNAPAAPDLSIDALDDDGKRFVSETNQRPVGFIEVDTKFDSGEVVEEATHKFRVRKSYLAATGASVESVRLYRDEADGWRSLPTRQTAEDEAFYYFEADTPGFSVFAIGTSSPVFETGAASLDSFDETTGEFEATVPVENVGDAPGEFEATLTADGAVVATETVALEANATTDLTLAGSVDEPGSVTLRLAGQSIGAVTRLDDGAPTAEGDADAASQADGDGTAAVDADDADDADDAASGLGASLAGLVLVLALGLFLFAVWRRRDDEEEEAGSEAGR
jgi:hypothetical protein